MIPDPDERLRRDLRHLGCYAVDREGAAEVQSHFHFFILSFPYLAPSDLNQCANL